MAREHGQIFVCGWYLFLEANSFQKPSVALTLVSVAHNYGRCLLVSISESLYLF